MTNNKSINLFSKKIKNIIYSKKFKVFILILMAFLTTCTFCLNLNIVSPSSLTGATKLARIIQSFTWAFNGYNITYLIILVGIYLLYKKIYFDGTPMNKVSVILSIFFALSMVFGYSYASSNSWDLIFIGHIQFLKSLMVGLGYYCMLYISIKKLYLWIDNYKQKNKQNVISSFIFERHPFILPFAIIFIMWLPYIISFYPCTTPGGDVAYEIYNTYHIENKNSKSVNLISEDVYINTHHPVIHQFMLYGFMKVGELFDNYTFGMFCYTLLQYIVTVIFLSYTFVWMRKHKIPVSVRKLALLLYIFLSYIPMATVNAGKDMYSSIFTLLFALKLYDFIKDEQEITRKKSIIGLSVNYKLAVSKL